MTQKKTSQTSPLQRAAMGVKQPFFSKKCIFRAENDIFLKNSFYSKFISDQKYIICTFWKKKFFTKIMILYFSPNLTYIQIKNLIQNLTVHHNLTKLRSIGFLSDSDLEREENCSLSSEACPWKVPPPAPTQPTFILETNINFNNPNVTN